jgi:glycosyltransferase involved in cell wall biosynthesis
MEDKIKILMTADTIGGVWTYTMTLCEALKPYNVEIHLVTMGKWLNDSQNKQIRQLDNVILYESSLKLEWMEDPWDEIKIGEDWIAEIYRKVRPDIMHFNNYAQVSNEWQCAIVTVFHSCMHTWYTAVKQEKPPEEWERYRKMLNKALFLSDVVVFPSFGIRAMAEQVHGNIAQSQVIYNGADLKPFEDVPKQPYVLGAGRLWDEAKNMCLLCDAATQLTWPLKIAGSNQSPDGHVFDTDTIEYLGELRHDQLWTYLKEASIFASAAVYEPFGLAVLEAASSGCALALSDISTFREIWGDAAVYFDPDDKADAARAIQLLIDDEMLRQSLSEKAKRKSQEFSTTAMAANYMALYNKLLAEQPQQLAINISR